MAASWRDRDRQAAVQVVRKRQSTCIMLLLLLLMVLGFHFSQGALFQNTRQHHAHERQHLGDTPKIQRKRNLQHKQLRARAAMLNVERAMEEAMNSHVVQ